MISMSQAINNSSLSKGGAGGSLPKPDMKKYEHLGWKDPDPSKQAPSSSSSSSSYKPSSRKVAAPPPPQQTDDERKTSLILKISSYLTSPIYQKLGYFRDVKVQIPSERDSLVHVEQIYEQLRSLLHIENKRMITHNLYEGLCTAGCTAGKNLLGLEGMDDFAALLLRPDVMEEVFQPELEEIAIEMSNGWIPNPYVRVALKAFNLYREIDLLNKREQQVRGLNKTFPKQEEGSSPGE